MTVMNPTLAVKRQVRFNIAREGQKATVMVYFSKYGPMTVDDSHVNYKQILAFLTTDHDDMTFDQEETKLLELFDIVFTIGKRFEQLGDSSLSVSGGSIYYDGDKINSSLTDAILAFQREGKDDWKRLVLFFEKMKANPNPSSVEQLYDWLKQGSWSITEDGDFIGYKNVTQTFMSHHSTGAAMVDGAWVEGPIPNKPGSVISMPRSDVKNDPGNACAEGLHIGTFEFARNFNPAGKVVTCKINPRNVVSVPRGERTKLRVCRYVVVEEVDKQGKSITQNKPADAKPTYDNDGDFEVYVDYSKKQFEALTFKLLKKIAKDWKVGTTRTPRPESGNA